LNSRRIRREIAEKYESDPKNWHILWSIDEWGHHNLLVGKDCTLWWLKEELINPILSVGCGIKSSLEEEEERAVFKENGHAPSFGLRPIQEEQLKGIISDITMGRIPQMPIKQILLSEPKPLKELGTPFFLQGPFHHTSQLADVLTDKQKELNASANSFRLYRRG
jgi:hypothetical protein